MNKNLFTVLEAGFPDDSTCFIETQDGDVFTYGEMLQRSAQYGNALIGLGVKPGDRVAVQVEKSIEGLMLYLGAIRAGAAFLPLNTAYTLTELSYFLSDAEPALVVCRPAMENDLGALSGEAVLETLGDDGIGGSLPALADSASASLEFRSPHFLSRPRFAHYPCKGFLLAIRRYVDRALAEGSGRRRESATC